MGPRSAEATVALYEVIAKKGVMKTMNPTVAETSKLFEGIYRDVNIALANELGRFCGDIDVDFKEVREAANSQPFCHLHIPGFVGGWCIPYYPHFVLQVADKQKEKLPLISLARKINHDKPQLLVKVADSVMRQVNGKGLRGSRVTILGLSFRASVADTSSSPNYKVIRLLLKGEVPEINAFDPYVTKDDVLEKKGIHLRKEISKTTSGSDLILIMTDHSAFKNGLTINVLLRIS